MNTKKLQLGIIKHLEKYGAGFFNSFSGASSLQLAVSQLNGALPALCVVPNSFEPTILTAKGMFQEITWTFDILVAIDGSKDLSRSGATGSLTVEDVFWQLYGLMYKWKPREDNGNSTFKIPFYAGKIQEYETNGAKSYWLFPYSAVSVTSDKDSWVVNQQYQAEPNVVNQVGNTTIEVLSGNGTNSGIFLINTITNY